ncbi:MAG: hypothetical protein ACYTEW_20415 [Planctomycetota bacterium]|jgi:hypothetical protein
MKVDRFAKVLLCIITVLLFLNLAHRFLASKPALAARGNKDIGRYQISAWAAQAGATVHHSGYYVLDTTTGKVVDSKMEVHKRGE